MQFSAAASSGSCSDHLDRVKTDFAKKYLRLTEKLLLTLLMLIHLTSGGPARMTELLRTQVTNYSKRQRGIFVFQGSFVIVQTYSKTSSMKQSDSFQARRLHCEVARFMFQYLMMVRPLAAVFSGLVVPGLQIDVDEIEHNDEDGYSDDESSDSDQECDDEVTDDLLMKVQMGMNFLAFSFWKNKRLSAAQYSYFFQTQFKNSGIKMDSPTFRQVFQTLMNPARNSSLQKMIETPVDVIFAAIDQQAGRSSLTGKHDYDRGSTDPTFSGVEDFEKMMFIYIKLG